MTTSNVNNEDGVAETRLTDRHIVLLTLTPETMFVPARSIAGCYLELTGRRMIDATVESIMRDLEQRGLVRRDHRGWWVAQRDPCSALFRSAIQAYLRESNTGP